MTHDESGEAALSASQREDRLTAAAFVSIIALLTLPLYAFQLWWFSPEILYHGECDPKTAGSCGLEHEEVFWVGTLLTFVSGPLYLTLTWKRLYKSRRWWPWPTTTATILIGWFVLQ